MYKQQKLEHVKQSANEKFESYKANLVKVYERNDCHGTRESIDTDVKHRAIELDGFVKPFITQMMNIRDDIQAYENDIVSAVYIISNQQRIGTVLHTLLLNRFREYCNRIKMKELTRNLAIIKTNVTNAIDWVRQEIARNALLLDWKQNLNRMIDEAANDFYYKAEKIDICKIIDSMHVLKEIEIIEMVEVNVDQHNRVMKELAHRLIINLKTVELIYICHL